MALFFAQRFVSLIFVLLGTAVLVFSMLYLTPGDPARMILSETPSSAESYLRLRAELGLDDPFHVQFGEFMGRLVRGDLGTSYFTKRPIVQEVASRLYITLPLMLSGMVIGLLLGIPLGILAAAKYNTATDFLIVTITTLGVSMPGFWVGLMLILGFSVNLRWLPVAGVGGPAHYVLPAITLGIGGAAVLTRLTRSSMVEILRTDYIRTAHAKGARPRRVLLWHAFRNALIPIVTVVGMSFGGMLGGAVVVETVFALPGLGRLLLQGVSSRDYPLVQGMSLIMAATFVIVNFIVDVIYSFINPRIRYG